MAVMPTVVSFNTTATSTFSNKALKTLGRGKGRAEYMTRKSKFATKK